MTSEVYSPTIKLSDGLWALSIEDPNQMSEHGLPNTQLKFVHEIHDEQGEEVHLELGEDGHECTLWYDQL